MRQGRLRPSNWKIEGNSQIAGDARYSGTYGIVDLGLAYRLPTAGLLGGFKALTLQMGYRTQIVEFRKVDIASCASSLPPRQVRSKKRDVTSTTYGFIFGISSAF